MTTLTPSKVFGDSSTFARVMLKIQDKRGKVKPLVYNRAQQDYLENRTNRDLIVKARQLGMSTCIQGEQFRHVTTSTVRTITLADTDDNTMKLRRISSRFYDNLPVKPKRGEANAAVTTYPEFDSEATIATAGGRSAGRAGTYNMLHGSEVAFWPRPDETIAGALQAVPHDGWAVLESTPNGAQGWFYETVMEALDGGNGWTVHFYPWWWDDGYRIPLSEPLDYTPEERDLIDRHGLDAEQINWRRVKKKELKHLFLQEYPEDIQTCFLLSGESYFGDITARCTVPLGLKPQEGSQYVGGLDFAQQRDYTVLSIAEVNTGRQVYLLRINNLDWQTMRGRILASCAEWGVNYLLAEENSIGSVNIEALRNEAYERGLKINIYPFSTTAKSKPGLIMGLHEGVHSGAFDLLNDPQLKREFAAFQATQTPSGAWRYEASTGEHDDIVIASALSWEAVSRGKPMWVV